MSDHQAIELAGCPFCGRNPPSDLSDTLYPSGTLWTDHGESFRSYHHMSEGPGQGRVYGMHCTESEGGCGASIYGDSEAEVIAAWNRRAAPTSEPVAVDRDAAAWRHYLPYGRYFGDTPAKTFQTLDTLAEADEELGIHGGRLVPLFAAPAAQEVPAAPQGYKVVPLNATEAMMHAAQDIPASRPYGAVYRAMLAAAPEVPAPAPVVHTMTKAKMKLALCQWPGCESTGGCNGPCEKPAPQGAQAQPEPEPEMNPACGCMKCNPKMISQMMFLCRTCGNKRCPHATDHRNACTNSNEPGQVGSAYGILSATSGNSTEQGEG